MSFAFDLWSYDDVRAQAAGILQRLEDGSCRVMAAGPLGGSRCSAAGSAPACGADSQG